MLDGVIQKRSKRRKRRGLGRESNGPVK
jgi:hypothetical protein